MAVIENLNQTYIDTQLRCPPGKPRIEIVDPQRTGLYIEVRATTPGEGTFYVRYKRAGKTCHERIARTREMTLEEARETAVRLKAERAQEVPAQNPKNAPTVLPKAHPEAPGRPVVTSPTGGMTLDIFMVEHYFPYVKGRKRSAPRDDQLYRLRIKAKFGHLPLAGIKRRDVERFGDDLIQEGLSHASANQHMQLLRRVCNLALSWEMLDRNVLSRLTLFRLDNQRETFLSEDEVNRLVAVCKTHHNRMVSLIVLFLLSTGARLSEALFAEWKQVDLAKTSWTIPATNSKSKKVKHLPLNPSAVWVVEQLESEGESPYLFPSPATGKPYTTITRAWYVIRKAAGLPSNFRIHDLRHTFASRLVSGGMNLFDVQTLLGHADARTSQRYAHLSMERAQKASNVAAFAVA